MVRPFGCGILALCLLLGGPAAAQVNIETYRGTSGVAGSARLSFSSDIGNVDVVRSDGAGNLTVDRPSGTTLVVLRGAAGFLGGERYASSGVLHLRYTRKVSPLLRPEVFAQADYDRAVRLDARSLAGAGVRWNLAREGALQLALGTAVMWEREALDLLPGDTHDDLTSQARLSTYLNLTAASERGVTLTTTAYYQPSLADLADARLLGTAELTTPLLGPFTQTTVLDFRIDRDPPLGVQRTDVRIAASLGVRFGS